MNSSHNIHGQEYEVWGGVGGDGVGAGEAEGGGGKGESYLI